MPVLQGFTPHADTAHHGWASLGDALQNMAHALSTSAHGGVGIVRHGHRGAAYGFLGGAMLIASLVFIGSRFSGPMISSLSTAPQWSYHSIEGIVVDFVLSAKPHLVLTTMQGRQVRLTLDLYATSVFHNRTVLNLTHLRLGELVRVEVKSRARRTIARSIEVLRLPEEMGSGPRLAGFTPMVK